MPTPRPSWLFPLLALLLGGCAADGTDFEALPFYREDRTIPGVTMVDIPPLLTTVDIYPPSKRGRKAEEKDKDGPANDGALPKDAEATSEDEDDYDYYVRIPWPFATLQKRGTHVNWLATGFIMAEKLLGSAGPAGRALSSDEAVRKDPFFPNLVSDDPTDGGPNALPGVFSFTSVDHQDYPDREGRRDLDNDLHLWPLFAYGYGDKEEHEYLAVLPFGGTTRGLIGKEKITWYGFPYAIYARVEDRAYTSHHVLWPLINWIDGPRNKGWRVLPFYGHYERKGLKGNKIYERTYIMWPFLTWSKSGFFNDTATTETFFFFPFYGQMWGPSRRAFTVLWPFFKYTEDRDAAGNVNWELRAPFPFLQIAGGKDRFKFDLFPLFGIKERPGFHRHFVLWPVWRYEALEQKDKTFSGQWFLPLFWRTQWHDKKQGTRENKIRAFPFFHYRSYRDGSVDVGFINPWFFDDPGWTRTLGRFFELYRYVKDKHGGVEHRALLGLFSYRNLPALAPGEARKGAPARHAYFRLSFLFGLFQYRNKGGERALRFLWLPEFPTWGEAKP